jgi:hypothetical protein
MKLWPLWLGLALALVIELLRRGGWVNVAAALAVALFLGPIVYVVVVVLFFDDTRKPPKR